MNVWTIAVALMIATSFGCAPTKPGKDGAKSRVLDRRDESDTVIRVGHDEVTIDEYQARTSALGVFGSDTQTRDENLRAVVEFELLADEAERLGYGSDPRVVHNLKNALAAEAVRGKDRAELLGELRKGTSVTDEAAVKRAFEEAETQR